VERRPSGLASFRRVRVLPDGGASPAASTLPDWCYFESGSFVETGFPSAWAIVAATSARCCRQVGRSAVDSLASGRRAPLRVQSLPGSVGWSSLRGPPITNRWASRTRPTLLDSPRNAHFHGRKAHFFGDFSRRFPARSESSNRDLRSSLILLTGFFARTDAQNRDIREFLKLRRQAHFREVSPERKLN
jgi:hypothetical protein